jgi:hypothetical protein
MFVISPRTAADSLAFQFTSFDFEHAGDYVAIYDDIPTEAKRPKFLGKFTGSSLPPPVFSFSGRLVIQMVTNEGKIRNGFEGTWQQYNCTSKEKNKQMRNVD